MNVQILRKWFIASRPHTMGLSLAVIWAGACQIGWSELRIDILLLSLCASGGFQLVSNFANDYGDFQKGTDTHRSEAYRSLSGGNFTAKQVKRAIIVLSLFSIVCVITLVYFAPVSALGKWVMFVLGILSVFAALAYTLGKRPYGYYALGDVMVFLFFGVIGVVGSFYLQGGKISQIDVWLVALSLGALSTTVLHINNFRDRETDKNNFKLTVANLLSISGAIIYLRILLLSAFLSLCVYAIAIGWLGILSALCCLIVAILIYRQFMIADHYSDYNYCLALTVKCTFLLSLPLAISGLFMH